MRTNRLNLSFNFNTLFLKRIAVAIIIGTSCVVAQPSVGNEVNSSSPKVLIHSENTELNRLLEQNKQEVLKNGQACLVLSSKIFNFSKNDIHSEATKVIDGLEKAGFQAYLVGGGVRDLLLGKHPHDFDVTTDATPDEVCKIFKNAKQVGSHFKIAKVYFDDEDIEVATFRKSVTAVPADSDAIKASASGMLISDNLFSKKLEDDALRRDLTVNAVFFDLNKSELIDYQGGIYDLNKKIIDTIREPELTFTQDPTRILRSLRFVAKLGFTLSDRTARAIVKKTDVLNEISPAQMFSEVYKFFNAGHSVQSYKILNEYHIFSRLFPDFAKYSSRNDNQALINAALLTMDERYAKGFTDKAYVSYATILWPQYQDEYSQLVKKTGTVKNSKTYQSIVNRAYDETMRKQSKITLLPENMAQSVKKMWSLQYDMLNIDSKDSMLKLVEQDEFASAFELLKIRASFDDRLKPYVTIYEPYYMQKRSL